MGLAAADLRGPHIGQRASPAVATLRVKARVLRAGARASL
ncbi:hypothetical protein XCR_3629 [Xanthomonas campestris pv. raphani 756C]|nr:hypothetical protein XCR_3629 [Xanthomonas campestris pv. raphani 756C]